MISYPSLKRLITLELGISTPPLLLPALLYNSVLTLNSFIMDINNIPKEVPKHLLSQDKKLNALIAKQHI